MGKETVLFGRHKIYTNEAVVDESNVVEVLDKAMQTHVVNQAEIQYLWDYYRGNQPILQKTKEVRENINEKIVVNRANEIISFYQGYVYGEPIQYTRRGDNENLTSGIDDLNGYMYMANKHNEDSRLGLWILVAGVGVRMVLPGEDEDTPIAVYTLDPRYSFVVYQNGLGEPPVMGVKFIVKNGCVSVYSVYTKDRYFEIVDGKITKSEPHYLGDIPILEYQNNIGRLGAFEVVLPLLDAINAVESNRLDDIDAYVNSFLALIGGTIDEDTIKKLEEYKMLCLPDGVDAKYLSSAMQQSDIQVLADNLYEYVLTITGMPNRNGGLSTSDTGAASALRDGWESANSRAAGMEQEFKRTEVNFIRIVLRILRDTVGMTLRPKDIIIKFSRRNYENIQTKSQVLTTMLANPKIHPRLAFVYCGMFVDPEAAYLESKEWWEEQERKEQAEMEQYVKSLNDGADRSAVQ